MRYTILILLVISTFIYFYNSNELFTNCGKKFTVADKNIYINNNQDIEINNINCNKLCIREPNGNIECITQEQLFNAFNLPAVRRHGVCIDDACLSKNDIQKLNGEQNVQFKNNKNNSCMGYGLLPKTNTAIRKKYRWESGGGKKTRWDMTSGKPDGCVRGKSKNCRRRRKMKRRSIKFSRRPSRRYDRADYSSIAVHSLLPKKCNPNKEESINFELIPGKKIDDINIIDYKPSNLYGYGQDNIARHSKHEKIGK